MHNSKIRRRTQTQRQLAIVAISTAAVVTMTGCTWFGQQKEEDKPTPVAIDSLDVPVSMLPTKPTADVSTFILPGTDSLPWVVAGGLAEPGEGAVPTVWTSDDGSTWTDQPIAPEFEGSFSGELAGSDELAALGGPAWNAGAIRSALWTSEDRQEWTEVDLPASFVEQYRLSEVAVSGTVVFGLGSDIQGSSLGLRIDGDEIEEFELPSPPDDELLYPSDLAVGGDLMVLTSNVGPEGEPNPTVTFVSDDEGASWSDAVALTDHLGYVGGTTWTGDGFIATGGIPSSGDPGAPLIPAAWTSADGESWTAETPASAVEFAVARSPRSDAWFGRPQAVGGEVAVMLAADNIATAASFKRSTAGAWASVGETSNNAGNGIGGSAIPLDASRTLGLVSGFEYARLGIHAGGWTDAAVLGEFEPRYTTREIVPTGEENLMILGQSNFEVEADGGWRNFSTLSLAEVGEDAVADAAWDPERMGALTGAQIASDDTGAEVRLGSYFPPGGGVILAEGWFRAGPDAEWTPLAGFEGSGATIFNAVVKAGDSWIAAGNIRETSATADPGHSLVWTSTDGTSWTRAAGEFGEGQLETEIEDVCTLPSGDPVGVGWIEESTGVYRTAVWMPDESGSWARVDVGELGTRSGSSSACASGEDGVVMSASVSGRDTLQLSTDGSEWEEVFRAERGISIGEPVAVPGGFAASGAWSRDAFSGPVVWLSPDGVEWEAVSVESHKNGSTTFVAPNGDDLLVTMTGRVGHPVSVIRDIEQVITDQTG